jgi:hypothetical protein
MTALLTPELLADYEQRLQAAGLVLPDILRPGLEDKEIDRRTETIGVRLPREAKVWYGWQDGTEPTGFQELLGVGIEVLSLNDAITRYREAREFEQDHLRAEVWRAEWFPIAAGTSLIACDCSVAPDHPSPVRALNFSLDEEFAAPIVPSIGAMVELWIQAWDVGWWYAEAPNRPAPSPTWQPAPTDRRRFLLGA